MNKKCGCVCDDALLIFGALKFSIVYLVKWPVLGLQRAPENSVLAPSVLVLYGLVDIVACKIVYPNFHTYYVLDVLWCQPFKLIQVVSTSEFHEYWWNDIDFIFFVPSI